MKIVVGLVLAATLIAVPGALAAFPADPPNDPNYAMDAACSRLKAGNYWLFSSIPAACIGATDPENAAGMSVDAAWRHFTTGDPTTVIAYVEGGVNYRIALADDLVNKIFLNEGELPLPEHSDGTTCAAYDCNGDGVFNIRDYRDDQRLKRPYVNTNLTPEDLIVAFGRCEIVDGHIGSKGCPPGARFDNDHNGYPNDISGWDFQHDSNDVQTDWGAYKHSDQQTSLAAAETNNGIGNAGVCPRCMLMYVKAGDEALARPDRQAEAVLYAVDSGASVIAGEAVGLGYSTFQKQAWQYAWDHDVPVSFDSNDFESTDHTDGMFFDHLLPANSVVPERDNQLTVKSFRNRSSITSWGTHAVVSVPTTGGSTSESVPVQAGVLALLTSYGRQTAVDPNADPGSKNGPLSAGEVTQLMIASASRVDDPALAWPGRPGNDWSLYYGYGRPNADKALSMVAAHRIPPVPDITAPHWYARFDPAANPVGRIDIKGVVDARRAASATYRVEYALGPEPAPRDFRPLPSAVPVVHGRYSGALASLQLSAIPRSFYARPFRNTGDRTTTSTDLGPEQYAVTVRVTVIDSNGLTGVDRRAVYVQHDPDRLPGFPRYQGPSGESPPVLADLQGRGETDIVIADADGTVHAYRPDGRDLPGFPVRTGVDRSVSAYAGARAYEVVPVPRDPVMSPISIGSLRGDGRLDIVAVSSNGRVYAWDAKGRMLRGFPVTVNRASAYPVPSPNVTGHVGTAGAFVAPVLADLDGDGRLEIVQAAWDGYVHALRADGSELAGWPVELVLPEATRNMYTTAGATYFRDAPIVATPTVADIGGEGHPQVIVGSGESIYPLPQVAGLRPVYAIHADGNRHAGGPYLGGWPVMVHDNLANLSGGIDFAVQATSNATVADFSGNGSLQVVVSTSFGTPVLFSAGGSPVTVFSPVAKDPAGADEAATFSTSGAPARVGNAIQYFAPASGVGSVLKGVVTPGPIYNLERGWDPRTGLSLPGFPAVQQGLSFFGSPVIASVDKDPSAEVVQTTDSMTLHAFRADGEGEAKGFPKFTGGWSYAAPAVGDLAGNGQADIVLATREGYLDAFRTHGRMADAQWCAWQGNARHTGVYSGSCSMPIGKRR
jgi:hypothetical protein